MLFSKKNKNIVFDYIIKVNNTLSDAEYFRI